MANKQRDLEEAVALMHQLIREQGAEYPDAHYQATKSFDVDPEELQVLYDLEFV
jgi:hypothetical protein